jgi:hypothetical protein
MLRVVTGGEPTGAEVAALTAVVLALQSRAVVDEGAAKSRWRDSTRQGQRWGRSGWR